MYLIYYLHVSPKMLSGPSQLCCCSSDLMTTDMPCAPLRSTMKPLSPRFATPIRLPIQAI